MGRRDATSMQLGFAISDTLPTAYWGHMAGGARPACYVLLWHCCKALQDEERALWGHRFS